MATNKHIQEWFKDPEFQDLPLSEKEAYISEYFNRELVGKDPQAFAKLTEPEQRATRSNFVEMNMATQRPEAPSRGFLSDIMVAGGRAAIGVPQMFLRAGAGVHEVFEKRVAKEPEGAFHIGKWARAKARDYEGFKEEALPISEEAMAGGPREWITGGIEAAGTSLAIKLPAAVAGFLLGGPPGAVLGWLSGVPLFSMAQYDQSLTEYRKKGLPEEQAREAAMLEGASEGGFELLTDIVEIITLGTGSALTAPGKAALKKSTFKALKGAWKQAVKKGGVVTGAETLGELANVATQAEVRFGTGIDDQRAWGAIKDNLGSIAVASLIFGSLGGGLSLTNARVTRKVLEDPDAVPERRMAAVKEVANALRKTSPEVAKQWTEGAVEAVTAKKAISLDVATDIDDAIKAAKPTKESDLPDPTRAQPMGDTGKEATEIGRTEDDPRTIAEIEELLSPGQLDFIKDQVRIHGPDVAVKEVFQGYDIAQEYARLLGEEEKVKPDVETREGRMDDLLREREEARRAVLPERGEAEVEADRILQEEKAVVEPGVEEPVVVTEELMGEVEKPPAMKERRVEVPLNIFQYQRMAQIVTLEDEEFLEFGKEGQLQRIPDEPTHKIGTQKTIISKGLSERHALEDIAHAYLNLTGALREGAAKETITKAKNNFIDDLQLEIDAEVGREVARADEEKPPRKPRKPATAEPGVSQVRTLRGKLKEMGGINFLNYTGELKDMPLDVKYLAKKTGESIDNVVDRLVADGWLDKGSTVASFLEDLRTKPEILRRDRVTRDVAEKEEYELTPEEKRLKDEEAWEPEAPPEGEYIQIKAEDLPEGREFTIIEGKSKEGWDRYEVAEKDPFSITLKDGQTIELKPLDLIEVRTDDLPKSAIKILTGREVKKPAEIKPSKLVGENEFGEKIYEDEKGRHTKWKGMKHYAPRFLGPRGEQAAPHTPAGLFRLGHESFLTKEELDEFKEEPKRIERLPAKAPEQVIPFSERTADEKKIIEDYNKKMTPEEWAKEYAKIEEPHYALEKDHSPLADEMIKDLNRENIKNANILEIGIGNGRDSIFMAQQGHNVVGIDIVDKAVEKAQENAKKQGVQNASFEVGDAESLQYEPESFDAIYSVAALHSTPIRFTFREIYRVLKPGGQAKLFLYTRTKTGNQWVSYWTPGEIKQIAKEEGFKIEKFRESHDTEPIEIPGVEGMVEQETHIVITTLRKLKVKHAEEITVEEEPVGKPGSSDKTAAWVEKKLAGGYSFTWRELFSQADKDFGGTQADGVYTVKDAYDAMELGVNRLINNDLTINPNKFLEGAEKDVRDLKTLIEKMPTQTKRTEEADEFQQFSTPPPLAYIVNWAANINKEDVVLEPSAGLGGIAVFSKLAGADQVVVNELSPRRAELLKLMGFDQVLTENAEQINNILPKDIKPSVVVMNPPFSSTAGRIKGRRATEIGAKHIEQALLRLETDGRLVAIVGKGMADDAAAFTDWWKKIKEKYNVRANIGIDGKDYRKYGTTFDNQILVIDKTGKTDDTIVTGKVKSFDELLPLLKEVRDARIPQRERPAAEPDREKVLERPGPDPAVLLTGRGARLEDRELEGRVPAAPGEPGEPTVRPGARRGDEVPGRRARPEQRPAKEAEPTAPDRGRLGAPTQPTISDAARISEAESASEQLQIRAIEKEAAGEMTEDLYESYSPELLEVPGGVKHPTPLVQSAAMAAVTPPKPTYKPSLPDKIIKKGNLSKSQVESVVYAGQSHEETLRDGSRRGYFIGDGTGVGKGREIAGIMWDNWNNGRKKAVWISEKASLVKDAKRDVEGTGWDPKLVFPLSKIKSGSEIKAAQGVLFTTYDTLKSEPKKEEGVEEEVVSRLEQIVNWLGEDFDGIIAFDESHNMGNAVSVRGPRGRTKPAAKALAGVDLQKKLPNARILYVSATGATDVRNLSYAERLGLWGAGTSFPNKEEFINNIAGGGIASMEMIAQNMKATGVYTARSLAYDGVDYDRIEHTLTPAQVKQYDKLAEAWQVVLQNFNEALEITEGDKSSKAKGRARAIFWASNQRFFNQVITSMQLPSVINKMHEDLKNGKSVVIQLVNTLEAAQKRALAKLTEDDSLEDLDLSPFDDLMQMVERSFPVTQFQSVMDADGNIRFEPVYDSEGNIVTNAEAEGMRDKLLDELGSLRREVSDGVIDQIIAEFGVDKVAEVTGRKQRVVEKVTERGTQRVIEKRSLAKADADADAFMNDKKKVLIFSEAGGTGRSYHADLDIANQDQRVHYLLQAGWRADKAVQGLGRTHRSNQKQPPSYFLVTTNLKGQARFISSIARRLDQLGALTKGARETGSQGIFSAKDNLETEYAEDALQVLLKDLHQGRVPDMTIGDFERQTALEVTDEFGNLKTGNVRVKNLLNRILSMGVDQQNRMFSEFSMRLDEVIDAHVEAGTLDVGLETLKADKIEKVGEETVHTDEKSGAETRYVRLSITKPAVILKYEEADDWAAAHGFYQNVKSKRVWAARKRAIHDRRTGDIEEKYILTSQTMTQQTLETGKVEDEERWIKIDKREAKSLWKESVDELPKTITEDRHLVTGALLPIWNRLIGHPRIMRVQTDAGEKMIGRLIAPQDLQKTLKNLGATGARVKMTPKEAHTQILANNYRMELANEWRLLRRRVADDYRIEIQGPTYSDFEILRKYGVFSERIAYQTRYFIPTDASGVKAIEEITRDTPIVEAIPPTAQYAVKEVEFGDLEGITVNVKAVREETGETITYEESARAALDDVNEQISVYEQMLECISG